MDLSLASSDEIFRELGGRLRAQRLAQGLPQAELAAMAGVSLGTIKSLERGAASSMDTFIRVAGARSDGSFAAVVRATASIHRTNGTDPASTTRARATEKALVKKLEVRYRGWGADWLLGTLADDGIALLLE